jgi:hypothetical protein
MCGGNLYNIMLRQELNKKKNVKPENEQAKTNENSNEYLLVKSMRKFGRMLETQYVQQSRLHQMN